MAKAKTEVIPDDQSDILDTNEALVTISAMWRELAETFEARARKQAVESSFPYSAVRFAKHAEACYWRATGDAESLDFKGGPVDV